MSESEEVVSEPRDHSGARIFVGELLGLQYMKGVLSQWIVLKLVMIV